MLFFIQLFGLLDRKASRKSTPFLETAPCINYRLFSNDKYRFLEEILRGNYQDLNDCPKALRCVKILHHYQRPIFLRGRRISLFGMCTVFCLLSERRILKKTAQFGGEAYH